MKNEVEEYLEAQGVAYQQIIFPVEHEYGKNELAKDELTFDEGLIYKTLVLKGDKTGVVIALVPLTERMDYRLIAKASGNRKIGLPPMEYVLEKTGYEHGANTPFGIQMHHPEYPIFVDAGINDREELIVSSGELTKGVQLSVTDFLKVINPVITDLVKK